MNSLTKGIIGAAVIWGVAGGALYLVRHLKPKPEDVIASIESAKIVEQPEAETDKFVVELSQKLNVMRFAERQRVESSPAMGKAFKAMTPRQQMKFVELTTPAGLKQMMQALNQMPPAERDRFVEKALDEAQRDLGFDDGTVNREMVHHIIQDGLAAFYSTASPEVKLQMGPILERIQNQMRSL